MKKSLLPILIIVAGVIVFYIFKPQKAVGPVVNTSSTTNDSAEEGVRNPLSFPGLLPDDQIKGKKAILETAKGSIEIELYADRAPKTVSNFIYLVDNAFYDDLTFHRVEPGFVIQGGDPNGDGTGDPGYKFEDEVVIGDYLKGTVAMANSGPNTNGSQFFICLENLSQLPKNYNLFGQVIKGMDVVSQISKGDMIKSIIIEPLT